MVVADWCYFLFKSIILSARNCGLMFDSVGGEFMDAPVSSWFSSSFGDEVNTSRQKCLHNMVEQSQSVALGYTRSRVR